MWQSARLSDGKTGVRIEPARGLAYCHRKIELVTEDNLVTYDGVQYIVCDEKCAAGQKIAAER